MSCTLKLDHVTLLAAYAKQVVFTIVQNYTKSNGWISNKLGERMGNVRGF